MTCDGKNIAEKIIKICCNGRKEDCEHAVLIENMAENLSYWLCRKPAD